MNMAVVVGSIVATQKDDSLTGKKLMIVQQINSLQEVIGGEEVAVDNVGAGVGELVLLTRGASARLLFSNDSAVDTAIVGIIDSFEK